MPGSRLAEDTFPNGTRVRRGPGMLPTIFPFGLHCPSFYQIIRAPSFKSSSVFFFVFATPQIGLKEVKMDSLETLVL